jgi:hypothetical protein
MASDAGAGGDDADKMREDSCWKPDGCRGLLKRDRIRGDAAGGSRRQATSLARSGSASTPIVKQDLAGRGVGGEARRGSVLAN